MKPHLLTMQAFGAYLNEITVDFRPLFQNGLFLITGPTGCGKTTILDAMSFALYGRATGTVRDARDMRSTSAAEQLDTQVSFVFELNGMLYRFDRSIALRRHKVRAGGTRVEAEYDAACYTDEGAGWKLAVSGTAAVSEEARRLLGFSCEQFNQVVVLPQGEFRRLLTASSTEKQKILETLFGTLRWQAFAVRLNEMVRETKEALGGLEIRRQAILKSAGAQNAESLRQLCRDETSACTALAAQLSESSKAYTAANDAYLQATKLDALFAEQEATQKRAAELEKQAPEIEKTRLRLQTAAQAAAVMPYYAGVETAAQRDAAARENLQTAQQASDTAAAAQTVAEKQAAKLPAQNEKLAALAAEQQRLAVLLKNAAEAGRTRSLLQKAEQEATAGREALRIAEDAVRREEENIRVLQQETARDMEEFILPLPGLREKQNTLQQALLALEEQKNVQTQTMTLQQKLTEKLREHKTISAQMEALKAALRLMEDALRSDEACHLAQTLEDGQPCPVCGSTSHPAPAALHTQGAAYDREMLEAQRTLMEKTGVQLAALVEEGAELRARYNEAKRRLAELQTKNKSLPDAAALQKELAETSTALRKSEEARNRHQQKQETLAQKQAALPRLREEQASHTARMNETESKKAALSGGLEQLLSSLPQEWRDAAAIEARQRQLAHESETLKTQTEQTASAASAAREAFAAAEARLTAAKEILTEASARLCEAHETLAAQCIRLGFPAGENPEALLLDDKKTKELQQTLTIWERALETTRQRAHELHELLLGHTRPDCAAALAAAEQLRAQTEALAAEKGRYEASLKNLTAAEAELAKAEKSTVEAQERYALCGRVAGLVGTDNPQKTPIHQFVLGLMLDDILVCANRRLNTLSRGQYALLRSEEPVRGGGSKGLELSVDDAWRGGARSVSTLSGGEMFLASLSLAFGLAEVVQSYAGGVRLDAIFIDEGFGSLDSETLETVMRTLQLLRGAGRLIGIISHVGELKERIPARIEVQKAPDGTSRVHTVAD